MYIILKSNFNPKFLFIIYCFRSHMTQTNRFEDMLQEFNMIPSNKEQDEEEYLNELQIEYFRKMLNDEKNEILQKLNINLEKLRSAISACDTEELVIINNNLKSRIIAIDYALEKIKDELYGYCESTGYEIGVKRLLAEPTARYSVEYQEKQDKIKSDISVKKISEE